MSTTLVATRVGLAAAPPAGTRRRPDLPSAGWLPTGIVLLLAAAVLRYYDVPAQDIGVFAGYLLGCLTIPGTLVWRILRGGPGWVVADAAAGTVLGYAVEVATYLPARAVGAPWLVLATPVLLVLGCILVPRLRRHWRGTGERVPVWWAWSVAGLVVLTVGFVAITFYRVNGLAWPASGRPYVDMPFHLALAGEVKHHMPAVIPFVSDEPLHYHWLVHAHLAASSWVTGIELHTLLFRLTMLPMMGLSVVLIAVIARQITVPRAGAGHRRRRAPWWVGPTAAAVALLSDPVSAYRWTAAPVSGGTSLFSAVSPTQTFGAMLVLPAVLLLGDLLNGSGGRFVGPRTTGRWVLLATLLTVAAGAKPTFGPMVLASLLFVVGVHLVTARRLHRPALAAAALGAGCLLAVTLVLFAGSDGDVTVQPLDIVRTAPFAVRTGLVSAETAFLPLAVAGLACLWFWLTMGFGALGLVGARGCRMDPTILLCAGLVLAGVGATLVLGHPGLSQVYFFASARPYLALLAAGGLACAVRLGGTRARRWSSVALLAGAAAMWLVRAMGGGTPPTASVRRGTVGLVTELALPYLALVVAAGVVWTVVRAVERRRIPAAGSLALAAVLLFATGAAIPTSVTMVRSVADGIDGRWRDVVAAGSSMIPRGGHEAARWLRDNSDPDDLVATNVHCNNPGQRPCENRHFWVSAYTERRVLVEGWGYTRTANTTGGRTGQRFNLVPYWNPRLLADNDAVFGAPSARAVAVLRDAYQVRWLFVDRRVRTSPALRRYAILRYASGDCTVYELVR